MKIFTGIVIRTSDKTAKVAVTRVVAHPIYKKRIKRTKNFLVHDEVGVEVGSQVQFVDSKPYSKLKRWKIVGGTKEQKTKNKEQKKVIVKKVVAPTAAKAMAGKKKGTKK